MPLFIASEGKSRRQSFLLFYLAGVIFWGGILYWLIQVNLIGFLLLIFYLALYFGIFGIFVSQGQKIIHRRLPTAYCLLPTVFYFLFIPSLWVALEFIRAHLFTGFGWTLLGYSQYLNLPIIQIADITGAYGVSFLVMIVNITFYSVIGYRLSVIGKKKKYLLFILPIFCLSSVLIYGYAKLKSPVTPEGQAYGAGSHQSPVNISIIQGNIPQHQKWDAQLKESILSKYIHLSEQAAQKDSPNLIVWPETAVPAYFNRDKEVKDRILELSQKINTSLLVGAATAMRGKSFNSAILISSGKVIQQYDKLHLVPFGEYVPGLFSFIRNFIEIGDFSEGKEWTVFPLPSFAVLICFEDVFPYLSRGFVKRGADFLINISNDAWFGDTGAPYQHCQSAVFRAVENRVNVIKCSNTGVSCFINPTGKIFSKFSKKGKDIFVEGYFTQKIVVEKRAQSFYTRFGDVFALFCLLFCAGFGIIKRHK